MTERKQFKTSAEAKPVNIPVPTVIDRTHSNQAYVTYGFADESTCKQFIKETQYDRTLYTAPTTPAQSIADTAEKKYTQADMERYGKCYADARDKRRADTAGAKDRARWLVADFRRETGFAMSDRQDEILLNLFLKYASPAIDAAGASEDARDAARYRWLRSATYDKAMPAMFDYDRSAHPYLGIRRSTEHLDEAIDAAIAKESGK